MWSLVISPEAPCNFGSPLQNSDGVLLAEVEGGNLPKIALFK
jgi:hypothetical protein